MTRLLLAALACCAASVTAVLYGFPAPTTAPAVPVPRSLPPSAAAAPALPAPSAPARPAAPTVRPAPAAPPEADGPAPTLSAEEAQVLMQVMAERGDPRSPALGGLEPRRPAPAAALDDPRAYSAFEAEAERRQAQAYLDGIREIPAIRERIEDAAQSGERDAAQLDEARAALQQLEMLRDSLARDAPGLLPEASPATP
ncbi:hypothetical protein [Pseudomonas mangiferae]|uniref:Phospholipase C accessory protein PlcR n=1 Tax=Pseudomonas mangiferae TaxID=2593654 RepID=A0A553GWF0_9PSED|nr:hypothetical protein [Pseudomonas mangiferae]TRX73834.1 hypothetical protein FM069_15590 [Pseudomonas mangiferae]